MLEIRFKIIKEGRKIHLGEICMIKTSTGEIKGVQQKSMNKPKDGANIELVHCLIFVLYRTIQNYTILKQYSYS